MCRRGEKKEESVTLKEVTVGEFKSPGILCHVDR